jgi:hypothetical protein
MSQMAGSDNLKGILEYNGRHVGQFCVGEMRQVESKKIEDGRRRLYFKIGPTSYRREPYIEPNPQVPSQTPVRHCNDRARTSVMRNDLFAKGELIFLLRVSIEFQI